MTEVTGVFDECGASSSFCANSQTVSKRGVAHRWDAPRSSLPAGSALQVCRLRRQRLATLPPSSSRAPDVNRSIEGIRRTDLVRRSRNTLVEGTQELLCNDCSNGTYSEGKVKDYLLGKEIGRGSYAAVCVGTHTGTGKKVAIKIYEMCKLDAIHRRGNVLKEVCLMENMSHPNIVVLHEVLTSPERMYLIMEYVDGGSIGDLLKRTPNGHLDEQSGKCIAWHMYQGIDYLHHHCISHRDIKLDNLLLVGMSAVVKIIDFGFSTLVTPGEKLTNFCGTPSYMAPEIITCTHYFGFPADIWSTGVVVFLILCGRYPFGRHNDKELHRKIMRAAYHIQQPIGVRAKHLLRRIFSKDASDRPTARGMLEDEWFACRHSFLFKN